LSAEPGIFDLLATIPTRRTEILTWAAAASKALSIPREQFAYRLRLYRDQLINHGVRLAQSTRHRTVKGMSLSADCLPARCSML